MSSPCQMNLICINGDFMKGSLSKCALCRFSPDNQGRDMTHYWSPTTPARQDRVKHPQLEAEKRLKKVTRRISQLKAKRSRDVSKRKVSRHATLAEKATETRIIKSTKNSGRQNKDGDHLQAGIIVLDTKLQTTRDNPIVFLHELEKVNADARRNGKPMGALVIRNKHNVGIVVLKEEDYAELTSSLLYHAERQNEQ